MRPRVLNEDEARTQEIEALAREHQAALYAMALKLSASPDDARDLVQDTFERALRRVDQLQPGSQARAWLVTILHNRFIDLCRKRTRQPRSEPLDQDALAAPELEAEPAWTRVTTEQLGAAVAALPDDFRRAFELHAIEGRSYVEIAETLGIAKATVGTRLMRARRKLKELLAPKLGSAKEGSR